MPASLTRLGRAVLATAAASLAALAVGVASTAPASAYSSGDEPQLSVTSPSPGAPVTVSGAGFRSGSTVTVFIYSTPVDLGTATADAAGEVSLDVTIPDTFEPGSTHRIELQGVDPDGNAYVLSRSITIAGGPSLAQTGAALVPLVAAASVMLAIGGVLVVTGRVRRRAAAARR